MKKLFTISQFNLYIKSYGGFDAFLKSPYLWYSCIVTLAMVLLGDYCKWYEDALSVLPNIVGFTIGAYAILLSINNETFLKLLANEKNQETTPYMTISSAFCHFIFIQTVTILTALLFQYAHITSGVLNAFGLFLFIYALMLILATVFSILFLSNWLQKTINIQQKEKKEQDGKEAENER